MNRRSFLGRSLTMGLFYGLGASIGRAQNGSNPNLLDESEYGKAITIDQQTADWFSSLTRPFNDSDGGMAGVASCCNAGDGYPIRIEEEAYPEHGDILNGVAVITDPSARQIVLPSGLVMQRPAITDPASLTQHFAGKMVCPLKDGNPTKTAWIFVRNIQGKVDHIYCVVPIPPGF